MKMKKNILILSMLLVSVILILAVFSVSTKVSALDADKDTVISYLKKVKSISEKGMAAQAYSGGISESYKKINLFINIIDNSIQEIKEIPVPDKCYKYRELTLEILNLIRNQQVDFQQGGEAFLKSKRFDNESKIIIDKEAMREQETTSILQAIDYWNIKELGVTKKNFHNFELDSEGRFRKK